MFKYFVRAFVNDILHVSLGKIEFLSQPLESYPIQQAAFEDPPVPFVEYPFID